MSEENKDSVPEFVPPSYDELRDENARLRAENDMWRKERRDFEFTKRMWTENAERANAAEAKVAVLKERMSWLEAFHVECKKLRAKVAAMTRERDGLRRQYEFQLDLLKFGAEREESLEAKIAQMEAVVEAAKKALEEFATYDDGGCKSCGGIGIHLNDCEISPLLSRLTDAPEKGCALCRDGWSCHCPPSPGKGE